MQEITPGRIIQLFGGVKPTSEALGCSRQTIYKWIESKKVPPQWQALARERLDKFEK